MIEIVRFDQTLTLEWNSFIKESKNGVFLFNRGYMEYHADRFIDHSLLFYNGDELLSVLPASEKGGIFSSHSGLTFGGLVLHKRASASFVLEVFNILLHYLKTAGFTSFLYKAVPYIFHQSPSGEDSYALFRCSALLYRRDISSVIDLAQKRSYTKGTKSNLSKARKANLRIEESTAFDTFMQIEEELLRTKFGTKPTHTTAEIELLANRFPDNIKLYLIYQQATCLGGTIIYLSGAVVHTQYIGINKEGKELGALDSLTDYLLEVYRSTHKFFSFGISTVNEGRELNEGLIRNKESFGARAIVHDFYKIQIAE